MRRGSVSPGFSVGLPRGFCSFLGEGGRQWAFSCDGEFRLFFHCEIFCRFAKKQLSWASPPDELKFSALLPGVFHEWLFWNCHLRRNRTLRRRLAFVCSFGCNINSGGAEKFFARRWFCRATCACARRAIVEPNGSRLPIRRRILRYGLRGAGAQLGAPV